MGFTMKYVALAALLAAGLVSSNALAASPPVHTFVLIVANNRSTSLAQPDLQYADDDGARYYTLFRSVAADADVALLTTFDCTSLAEYPELAAKARPPSKVELERASTRMARAVTAANEKGETTRLYFVYAGHGDMIGGKGVLELEDDRIDGAFIEQRIVENIPAGTKHILLDSCNSFFVINPRKPGGRRWATPSDMAFGFSARHPEVGLFLSTNSESEVFEWSEIESGVFSHEVRSGLSGGADIDGDGNVSYRELAGFVERANAGIVRPGLRPHLYYRGPQGDDHASLFRAAEMTGRRVTLDSGETRLWIKNETGERLIDLHKEPGPMTITVPGDSEEPLSIFVQKSSLGGTGRPTVVEYVTPGGAQPVKPLELASVEPAVGSRGDRLFGTLFETAYGPLAYAQYERELTSSPEPVYGLAEADLARMHNYLNALAGEDRYMRSGAGLMGVGLGAMAGSAAVALGFDSEARRDYPVGIAAMGAVGAGLLGAGLYSLLTPSRGELALRTFEQEVAASHGNGAIAFVKTEEWLEKLAAAERTRRSVTFWGLEGLGVGIAGLATAIAVAPPDDLRRNTVAPGLLYTEAALLMSMGFFVRLSDTPTERMLKLYRDDPGLKIHFGAAPTASGATFGLSGTF